MIKKPESLLDLVELQRELDFKTGQTRPNGFIPRQRTELDLRLALDDEFNEFMKELPKELNFKTWKEIKHDPKKQLEEFVDCLFFILALIDNGSIADFVACDKTWECYGDNLIGCWKPVVNKGVSIEELIGVKANFLEAECPHDFMRNFIWLAKKLRYTKEQILEAYWEKWNINMKRINKDWSITSQN